MKTLTSWFCLVGLSGLLALPLLTGTAAAQDDARPTPPPVKICTVEQPQCVPPAAQGCPMSRRCGGMLRCVLSILVVIHVMLAVWVYTDIRKRGEGHGLFIVLALLGGIPAAILYALVRLGDKKSA